MFSSLNFYSQMGKIIHVLYFVRNRNENIRAGIHQQLGNSWKQEYGASGSWGSLKWAELCWGHTGQGGAGWARKREKWKQAKWGKKVTSQPQERQGTREAWDWQAVTSIRGHRETQTSEKTISRRLRAVARAETKCQWYIWVDTITKGTRAAWWGTWTVGDKSGENIFRWMTMLDLGS